MTGRPYRLGAWLVGVLAPWCWGAAWAQPQVPAEPDLIYTVKRGDTLSRLVSQHLTGRDAMALLVRNNRLSHPDILKEGQELRLPRQRLRVLQAEALVSAVGCREAVRQRGEERHTLVLGDAVRQGDTLSNPVGCRLDLSLSDASSVRVASGSVTHIKTLKANTLQPSPQLELELQEGRVEGRVPRKRAKGDASFEIRTSVSLAGIRGTEFRVGYSRETQAAQIEVLTGRVAARGLADSADTLVGAQEGLSVPVSGRALPVEALPAPVQILEGLPMPGERMYALRLQADARVAQRRVVWSQEVNATRFSAESVWQGQDIPVTAQDGEAAFLDVRGVSASGMEGPGRLFGVCQGYRLQQSLRCDVRFDLSGWSRSALRLTRLQTHPVQILDAVVPSGSNDQAVLRGLQEGTYHWVLDQVLPSGAKVQSEGQFQLVALSASR